MLKTDGLIVSPARPVEVFGIGENSLVRFLIDTLHDPNGQTLEEVSALAAFVVAAAKKYCPQYCGGETTVVGCPYLSQTHFPYQPNLFTKLRLCFFQEEK